MKLREGTVEYIEQPAEGEESTLAWRFTLRQLSVLDDGRYSWARDQVERWVEAQTGIASDRYLEKGRKPNEEEMKAFNLFFSGLVWAHVHSTLKMIQTRLINAETLVAVGEWEERPTPEWWASPDGFLADTDPELIAELERVAIQVNPTFNLLKDDSKKKYGVKRSNGPSKA